jgi:hypothetical protein
VIRTTRRAALMGALAVPTVAGLAHWRWKHGERSVLLHDPALAAGRRFAAAGAARGAEVRAIDGDRIRFAREVLEGRPALVAGVSRHADFILIEDAAREAGYRPAATIYGRARTCAGHECQPGWQSLGRMASAAGEGWIEALAEYAAQPGRRAMGALAAGVPHRADPGLVLGWILAPQRVIAG